MSKQRRIAIVNDHLADRRLLVPRRAGREALREFKDRIPWATVGVIGDELAHEQHRGFGFNLTACGQPIVAVHTSQVPTCIRCAGRMAR